AEAWGGAGGVVVGRAVAGGGAGAAGGSRAVGRAAGRPGAVDAGRGALAARGGRGRSLLGGSWSSDDLDADQPARELSDRRFVRHALAAEMTVRRPFKLRIRRRSVPPRPAASGNPIWPSRPL